MRRARTIAMAITLAGASMLAHAHADLGAVVDHAARITLGADYIDISLTLRFHAQAALHEREHMDRDGNGRIDDEEVAAFLETHRDGFLRDVALAIDGTPHALDYLYEPRIALEDHDGVAEWPLVISLHFFAATPPALSQGSILQVADALWASEPAVAKLSVTGRDGARLRPLPVKTEDLEHGGAPAHGHLQVLRAVCVVPPETKPLDGGEGDAVQLGAAATNTAYIKPARPGHHSRAIPQGPPLWCRHPCLQPYRQKPAIKWR